jgi:hypothetical protein
MQQAHCVWPAPAQQDPRGFTAWAAQWEWHFTVSFPSEGNRVTVTPALFQTAQFEFSMGFGGQSCFSIVKLAKWFSQ